MKSFFRFALIFTIHIISIKVSAQCATAPYTSCSGLPTGAIAISPEASFGMDNGVYYYTGGATTLNLQNFNGGTLIICGGPVTMNGFNTGGDVIVTSTGSLTVNGNIEVQNGRRIFNMGRLTVIGSLRMNSDGIVNSGVITTGTLYFNSGGRMCMGNGAAVNTTNIYSDQQNSVTVPSGNACISYTGTFNGNQQITNTQALYLCSSSTASSPSNVNGGTTAGNGNLIQNCTNCGVQLSVDLLSFDVSQQVEVVELTWITANESNISHFLVEIAGEDGFFEPLKSVTAKGGANTRANYSLIDETVKSGIRYYRLSEVDYSGKKTVLGIRTISINNLNSFVVYPNPTGSGMSTKINYQAKNNSAVVEFYSPVGKLVTQIELNTNSTFYETNLPAGQYIVRLVENGQPIEVKSLVVL